MGHQANDPVMTNQGHLIVNETAWGHIRATEAWHRNYPEIRAAGESPEDAVRNLARSLSSVLDTAITHHDRAELERALEDARTSDVTASGGGDAPYA